MKILNFGSLNLDLVYRVPHFVRAGETLASMHFSRNVGGKGLNQSIALANAGANVYHAGQIGADGVMLREFLQAHSVNTLFVRTVDVPTGNAMIQVEDTGNNSIVLYGGANMQMDSAFVDEVLDGFGEGDYLLLQNEINQLPYIITCAAERGINVVLNPSPINATLKQLPLDRVKWLILNEIEGNELSNEKDPERILDVLLFAYPHMQIVLTLGSSGSIYADAQRRVRQKAYCVQALDTTAAGDTFTGFLIASIAFGEKIEVALDRAAKASAISVTRVGAAASIPSVHEVLHWNSDI